MRFRQANRRGTASWWGIALCALLFAGTYVVFDILDVDGSRMSRGSAPDGTLTATLEAAGERFFRTPATVARFADLLPLPLSHHFANTPRRNLCAGTFLRQRRGHGLPRVMLTAERTLRSTPIADPL